MIHRYVINSPSNSGSMCKQYFNHCIDFKGQEDGLVVRKLVLCEAGDELWKEFKLLKTYKGMELREQNFGIKIKTLEKVFHFITSDREKKLVEALEVANEYVKHTRDHIAAKPEDKLVIAQLAAYNEELIKG